MRLRRALALAGAVTAVAFTACKEPPFAPRWDADEYFPLTTQPIPLSTYVPAPPANTIPNGQSKNVSFPPQRQDVTGALADVLKNLVTDPSRARTELALTISKTKPLSTADTLFVAPDSASLFNANPSRIVFPLSLLPTDVSVTDSIGAGQQQIAMLQSAGSAKTPLWIQLRGSVSNNSGSTMTITSADSINIRVTVTARVAVVHK
jgi:hypothetical protein